MCCWCGRSAWAWVGKLHQSLSSATREQSFSSPPPEYYQNEHSWKGSVALILWFLTLFGTVQSLGKPEWFRRVPVDADLGNEVCELPMGTASWTVLLKRPYSTSCTINHMQTSHSTAVREQGVHFTLSVTLVGPRWEFCTLVLMPTLKEMRKS